MIRLAIIALVLAASQAHALSCMRPDVATSFQRFAASEKSYVVLLGQFNFDKSLLPKAPDDNPNDTRPNTFIPATFAGKSLSRAGFVNDFTTQLTVNATCLGPWCSGMSSDVNTVAFVEKRGSDYTLTISPCGGAAFAKPSPQDLKVLTRCLQGKTCEPALKPQ